ncbi:hypothetical protein [Nonomuraea sp. LPB2021202275-12-8]|uniref:hypothetical protein n=1 Tax=Nonomuraea sp. LPB2021202275-12-8 TaxID=3120159 RepID=UPI00300CE244
MARIALSLVLTIMAAGYVGWTLNRFNADISPIDLAWVMLAVCGVILWAPPREDANGERDTRAKREKDPLMTT